jgi:hypothetical protein
MDSQVVDRDAAMLHQLGGELYKPSLMPVIAEMANEEVQRLKRLLTQCSALTASHSSHSVTVFNVEKMIFAPSSRSPDLNRVGRDLIGAIEGANRTNLVTRGPLDLKSADVIPPQIVLDQEVNENKYT